MKYTFLLLGLLLGLTFAVSAQTNAATDTTVAKKTASLPDTASKKWSRPKKAAILSAILPGAGQAFNRKYWKIPILYAGGVTLGYFINFNNKNYQRFKTAVNKRTDGDALTIDEFVNTYPSEDQLRTGRDYYRRNRDLLLITSVMVYLLNIADASVDAHLAGFDVSDNLALSVQPSVVSIPYSTTAMATGLSLQLRFRK